MNVNSLDPILRRGPPGQDGLLYEANTIRIGEGDPHGAESNPGQLVLRKVTSLMRNASGLRRPFKRGPQLWLGETLATNQSEAFVRTATVTKMTAEVVP